MGRIFGYAVGVVWLGIAFFVFSIGQSGVPHAMSINPSGTPTPGPQPDFQVWWTVAATLLTIAGLGALGGTYFSTRSRER